MNICLTSFMLKKYAALVALSMAIFMCVPASVGAQGAAEDQLTGKLVITGSSTIAPLIAEIGKRFESLHPKVRVDVQTGGPRVASPTPNRDSPISECPHGC